MFVWGSNKNGQLGLGDNKKEVYNTPQELVIPDTKTFKQVEVSDFFSFASTTDILGNDHLYMWGANDFGQLGLGDYAEEEYNTPQEVVLLPQGKIKSVDIVDHSFANQDMLAFSSTIITDDSGIDHLYMWGDNSEGELGLGSDFSEKSYNIPQEVTGLPSINKGDSINEVSLGMRGFSLVEISIGGIDYVYSWGTNDVGSLGIGTTKSYDTPQKIDTSSFEEVKQISAGHSSSGAVVTKDGKDYIYSWGFDSQGQLGIGDPPLEGFVTVPTMVINLPQSDTVKQICYKTSTYSGAILVDPLEKSHLYMWGESNYGEFGSGTNKESFTYPNEIKNLPEGWDSINDISFGSTNTSLIVSKDGKDYIYSTGGNLYGQLGIGSFIPKNVFTEISLSIGDNIPNDGSINHESITSTTADFNFTNSESFCPSKESYNLNVKSNNSFDWTSGDLNEANITQTITGFKPGTTYINFTVQPFDLEGHKIGQEFTIEDSFTTTNSEPIGITSATIDDGSVNENSFNFDAVITPSKEGEEVVSDYKIEAIAKVGDDSSEQVFWTSTIQDKTNISLTVDGLESHTRYSKIKFQLIDIDDPDITIGSVFETNKSITTDAGEATGISSAIINESSITFDSFEFDMDISTSIPEISYVDDYKIEVSATNNYEQRDIFWTSTKQNDVHLTDVIVNSLESGKTYYDVEFQIIQIDGSKIGNPFKTNKDITTKKKSAAVLSNVSVPDIGYNSALIKVKVNASTNLLGEDLEEYGILVKDTSSSQTWEKNYLESDGFQDVEIDKLESDKSYDLTVEIKGDPSSVIVIPTFSTLAFPFKVDDHSFVENESTKNTFTFSIKINLAEPEYKDPFDTQSLHLYSNNSEIDIEYEKFDGNNIYTYKAVNLKPKQTYDNLTIFIDGAKEKVAMINKDGSPSFAKTKVNMTIIYISISIGLVLTIIVIVLMIIFIVKRHKKEAAGVSNRWYRSNFY